jgi:AcrR family transcriptional regulator
MKERPVREIGINQICTLAGVSRSTFYAHYDNVNDLLEQIEEEEVVNIKNLEDYSSLDKRSRREIEAAAEKILQYIAANEVIRVLISENGDTDFQKRMFSEHVATLQEKIQKKSGIPADKDIHESYSVFLAYGSIGLLQYWFKENMHIPIPALAKILVSLIHDTIR